jgi:hypothetical protein
MELNPLGKSFFAGHKKYLYLENYVPLRGRGDKDGDGALSQKKLMLSMDLTGAAGAPGMPGWIADAMAYIGKDKTGAKRITFDKTRTMPGMTMEVYATADTKERALLLTACEFAKFTLEREGLAEKARFSLAWQVRCADPMQLHEWLHGHFHQQFAVAFSQGQETIDFDGAPVTSQATQPKDDTNQATLPGYDGENADTMNPKRDGEFRSPGTRKTREAPAPVPGFIV